MLVRSHEVKPEGYEYQKGGKVLTVFSAPNYCGEFDNSGALMSVDDTLMCSFSILRATDPNRPAATTTPGSSNLRPKTPPNNAPK